MFHFLPLMCPRTNKTFLQQIEEKLLTFYWPNISFGVKRIALELNTTRILQFSKLIYKLFSFSNALFLINRQTTKFNINPTSVSFLVWHCLWQDIIEAPTAAVDRSPSLLFCCSLKFTSGTRNGVSFALLPIVGTGALWTGLYFYCIANLA